MPQYPTSIDDSHPQKNLQSVFDPAFLQGTIPVAGSLSSAYDLSGWTKFALQIDPNGGTLLGTVLTIQAAQALNGQYNTVYGSTGAVASTIQCGSTGTQTITGITALEPFRFVRFAAPGTQAQAPILTLLVK